MRPAALLGAAALLSGGPGPTRGDPGWFVDPITVKVMHDRQKPFPSSAKAVDMAGQRGECERAQIWGWDDGADLTNVELQFGDLTSAGGATLPKAQWSYKQQGYVNATSPTHVPGGHPDRRPQAQAPASAAGPPRLLPDPVGHLLDRLPVRGKELDRSEELQRGEDQEPHGPRWEAWQHLLLQPVPVQQAEHYLR